MLQAACEASSSSDSAPTTCGDGNLPTEGLQEKMDVYLAADRLTSEEYSALSKMLTAEAAE